MDRRKVILVALAIACAGVLGTYARAWTATPEEVAIGDILGLPEGAYVEIVGLIAAVPRSPDGGSLLLRDPRDGAEVAILLGPADALPPDTAPGALASVRGTVGSERGLPFLAPARAALTILRAADENRRELRELLAHPAWFDGMTVVVAGEPADLRWTGSSLEGNLTDGLRGAGARPPSVPFRVWPYPTLAPEVGHGERLRVTGGWWLDSRTGSWTVHGNGVHAVGRER